MTIGEKLKRERKKLGYELNSVAKKTKIAKMFLIAIENDDLSSLPGGVYTRNFLRAYAKFLNLDEDIITAEYHDQYDVKPHFVVHQEQTKRDDGQFKRERSRFLLLFFLLLLIVAGAIVIYFYYPFWKEDPVEGANHTTISASHPLIRPAQKTTPPAANHRNQTRPVDTAKKSVPPSNASSDSGKAVTDEDRQDGVGTSEIASSDVSSRAAETRDLETNEALVENNEPQAETQKTTKATFTESSLPFSSVDAIHQFISERGLMPSIFYGVADHMDQVFIIEAVDAVQLEVYVDGAMASRRLLRPGQVRFYRAGNYNRVIIEDISRVNIQEGLNVFSGAGEEPRNVFLHDFEAGNFLTRLKETINTGN